MKQNQRGTEKLSREGLGMDALFRACLTMASRLCVALQVSHFATPD